MPNDKPEQPAQSAGSEPKPPTQAPNSDSMESLDADPNQTPTAPQEPQAPQGDAPAAKKTALGKRVITDNLYLFVFALLILAAGAVVYISMKGSKPTTTTNKTGSLTSQQLASIKGNTTLVGDAKQTIDIQSDSIFEGQVLLRSDLSVAGGLKVGGKLSLPSLEVGDNGTFGQLGVNGGLNVKGDTTLQGQLTVQKKPDRNR